MANVCPTGLFFETQPIEEGLFKQASSLQTHKHPSVCLQRKGDQRWICMRMRSPGRRRPCPSKARVAGGLAAFVPAPARLRGLTGRAPRSRLAGPRRSAHGPLFSLASPEVHHPHLSQPIPYPPHGSGFPGRQPTGASKAHLEPPARRVGS